MKNNKNTKFNGTDLTDKKIEAIDKDLKQNGINSIYLKEYINDLKNSDPNDFEAKQKLSVQKLKEALTNKGENND